jgi:hypothetical protein
MRWQVVDFSQLAAGCEYRSALCGVNEVYDGKLVLSGFDWSEFESGFNTRSRRHVPSATFKISSKILSYRFSILASVIRSFVFKDLSDSRCLPLGTKETG